MLTATLRLFSEESGSSDYSPKTDETIAEICRSGQYNGEEQLQATSYKLQGAVRAYRFQRSCPRSFAALGGGVIRGRFTTEGTEHTEV